ncbi:HAMP domain-containing sensor histidine kinase [Cohnella lubricantis]|uniref:histidine kinase n=1 Tax=Cohnella lubricantis TaxID=2163172 RepID=A0A841TJU0_9BACL|nr:HAMP domain-containing sensor histidine kinase [Cohnella lubricantis]MBB6679488.1 HAMP domain-containing histidine kinase [Cohnella lubricantis]MBP2118754.1 signal transduction histidine kinase [Cohnella lubricantis]
MLFVWLALWCVAAFMALADRRSAELKRLGAVAFFGGTGALAAVLDDQFLPYLDRIGGYERWEPLLYDIQAVSAVSSYYGIPYCFLLFALSFGGAKLSPRLRYAVPGALLVPIVGSVLFTPSYTELNPISFDFTVWWAVPYIVAGAGIVLLRRPRHSAWAQSYAIVCMAVLPPMLFFAVMNYLLPSLGMRRMWVYNTWLVGLGVALFVVGLFTYGFLGLRLLVDRRRLDSTLRAVTSGTAILNHAMKNDAGKIKLFGEKMKAYAESTGQPELLADIETVLSASRHMQEMISRVHRRTEDLALRPAEADLGALARETAAAFAPRLGDVRLTVDAPDGWRCVLDREQVQEALHNLIANALEAMEGRGELRVAVTETKRELVVEVRDSGPGMNRREAARAMEPFFTLKEGGTNFGLGLPCAYHVIRKHGGTLHIDSRKGAGTRVFLTFPKRKVRARFVGTIVGGGRMAHGTDTSMDRRG